jgi:hypothetical protein
MAVTFEVVDRYGNVMTTDNTTSFTVNVTGAATFTGATTGAIVSGSGTSSVLVRVTGGVVTLSAADLTQETVTFTAVDSQMNGLRYPGTFFTQTAPQQTTPCQSGVGTFAFNTPATPTGPGTITVVSRGDLNGGTSEYLDVFMESTTGTLLGSAFVTGAGQCLATDATATLPAPLATLQAALADGTATVAIRGTASISCTLCTAASNLTRVTLTFPMTITGTFQ